MTLRLTALFVFLVLWLVPFYITGSTFGFPFKLYSRLKFQYGAAGLFTVRVPNWNQTLFQVKTKAIPEWQMIDTAEFSPMGALGFRQRLDRVFQDTSNKPSMTQVRQRLAEWLAKEYLKRHPNVGEVTGLRMGQTLWAANRPEMAMPKGAWVRDPVDVQPSKPFKVYASFTISQGKATTELASKVPAKPASTRTTKTQ